MNITEFKSVKEVYTHAGTFHADDVFSTALLKMLNSEIKVHRVNKVPENTFAYDIGLGRFDHHQADAEIRPNGIKYAAFGLLWREFGGEYLGSQKAADEIDRDLIQPLDDHDNGGGKNPLAYAISCFNPAWFSDENPDIKFNGAVISASEILNKVLTNKVNNMKAEKIVNEADRSHERQVVWLPKEMPWKDYVEDNAIYVVYPCTRGGINIECVSIKNTRTSKKPFPEEWRGKPIGELKKFHEGLTFCHATGFVCAVENLDYAKEIVEIMIGS